MNNINYDNTQNVSFACHYNNAMYIVFVLNNTTQVALTLFEFQCIFKDFMYEYNVLCLNLSQLLSFQLYSEQSAQ